MSPHRVSCTSRTECQPYFYNFKI